MLILLSSLLYAHPFSTDEYSLRTAMQVSDKGVSLMIALEVPISIALEEIGAKKDESRKSKQKKIDRYNKKQWQDLGKALDYRIDGVPQKGKWLPIEHPSNGKAAEGFFVYLVGFKAKKTPALKAGSVIEIHNKAYPDTPMVYTASTYSKAPWFFTENSADTILGEKQALPLSDAERWSRESELRSLRIVLGKK